MDTSTRPIHWLNDPGLQHLRLKLITTGSTTHDPYFEFLGIENDLVKVRDKANIKFLSFDSVSPLPPTSQGELVTPKSGEMQGIHLKVIRITESICVVRKPGTKPTKKNPDTEFALTDLIQVYPVFRELQLFVLYNCVKSCHLATKHRYTHRNACLGNIISRLSIVHTSI